MIAIAKRRHAELAGRAIKYVAELLLIEPLSPAFDHKLEALDTLGRDEIAQIASRLASSHSHVAAPPLDGIGQATVALRNLATGLEPMRPGNLKTGTKRWGLRPATPDPTAYFRRYLAGEGAIAAALAALTRERDSLLRANVGIAEETAALAPILAALEEHSVFAQELALTLAARIDQIAPREPLKARRLGADAMTAVQSRARDIAEARALAQQAIMARKIVSDTNVALIDGINQAISTMVMVLKTAIEAARLLAQQELVLDNIAGLRHAATNVISAEPPAAADSAEALQAAFVRLYDTLDRLETERTASAARLSGIGG